MSLLVALLGFVVLNEAYIMYETNLSLVGKNKIQQISFQLASWNRKDDGSNASAELAYAKHFIFDHFDKNYHFNLKCKIIVSNCTNLLFDLKDMKGKIAML